MVQRITHGNIAADFGLLLNAEFIFLQGILKLIACGLRVIPGQTFDGVSGDLARAWRIFVH